MNPSQTPLVSVIIPTYNRSAYLKECLESALAQTVKDIDIWVVDDGSTDDTQAIVGTFSDPRIHYLQLPHCGLPAVPRNVGIQKSKGRFIAFLDSDDLWLPQKLEKQLDAAQRDSEAGLFYTLAENFNTTGANGPSVVYNGKRDGHVFDSLFFINFIPILTVMVPRNVLEITGVFDERSEFRALEDYDLILRIAAHQKVHFVPETLARHRVHTDNIWAFNPKTIDQWEMVLWKNFNNRPVSDFVKRRALAQLDLHRFKFGFRKVSTRSEAGDYLKKAIRLNPLLIPAYIYWILLYTGGLSLLRGLAWIKAQWREFKTGVK